MENVQEKQLKPRVGSALSYSWSILWDKFITLFLVMLAIWVISIPMSIVEDTDRHPIASAILGTFGLLYMIFLMAPLRISADFLFLKAIRKADFEVKELFDVFKNYLNVVLAGLLSFAIIGIGFAFLLIPGFIFACRLAFVPYLVMDKKLDPVKAVEESWRITRGYGWRIFWMYIVSIFLFLGGLMVFIFGAVIAVMWIHTTFAALYQAVIVDRGEYETESTLLNDTPDSTAETIQVTENTDKKESDNQDTENPENPENNEK